MNHGEPAHWFLCFGYDAAWWVRLICGRGYSHVRAFGAIPRMDLWVFYDVSLAGTTIAVARDGTAECENLMAAWMHGYDVIHIARRDRHGLPRWPVFSCCSTIAHLIGLPGALRPQALFRHCLQNGGVWIDGRRRQTRPEHLDAEGSAV